MNYKSRTQYEYEQAIAAESERLMKEMAERMRRSVDDQMYGRSHPGTPPPFADPLHGPTIEELFRLEEELRRRKSQNQGGFYGGFDGPTTPHPGPGFDQQRPRPTRAQFLEVCHSPRGLASFARSVKLTGTRGFVRRCTVYGAANGDIHLRDERHTPPADVELLGIFTAIEGNPRVFRFEELT